ncbi:crotonase/enoyl-CoA hydratase family protein [Rhodococcus erythropolis]|uniref:crotonase/enoyl-CoA hydratase family protein n=1 Tax=Rhodococcus erythropolis TaxID=1833 RepID=UPI0008A52F46|nr:crotonase/enoyl-CoA hydratase family protein [Rhodococcus erythropolis]MBT1258327.1 crotonase/enoyl-CoA hydratase family protein [Rhodococcus erythropolis]MQP33255.1 crotonase/enoyl-CoA hydratase family protein [Rhodococcus erythropolis]OHF24889.1 enoyl-CoA hydratase [Rhodococcus erythropolis]
MTLTGDTEQVILTERVGRVLIVTINRPRLRNAINLAVAEQLSAAMDVLDWDSGLSAAVLTGAGDCFCAGMDLNAFLRGERPVVAGRGFAGLVESPPAKPLIAAVDGPALAGGFEIVLAADLVVASTAARFGLPEVTRGLVAAGGGLFRLPRALPRAIALEVALTGGELSAEAAHRFGLVNRLVAPGDATAAALALAEQIAANGPLAVTASKRVVVESPGWPAQELFARTRAIAEPVFGSADAREGAAAFTQRRAPLWSGI